MRRWSVLIVLLLAGCGQAQPDGAAPPSSTGFEKRAAEVAEAWRASALAESWRGGFVPLQELVVLPQNPGFDGTTKMAYANGWFRSTTQLSTKAPGDGSVRFRDGENMSVPLISAAEAYRSLNRRHPPCPSASGRCTPLTVTGVKLGTVQVRTSRGAATVPAWLFTVDEIAGPLARVAVAPAAISTLPPPSPAPVGSGLAGATDITKVDGATLTYRLFTGACDKDVTPLVYEADDIVVIGGHVGSSGEGPCVAMAVMKPVTVTLAAPLGDRVVLDISGKPLTLPD
jgi:hypothetical protein